MHQSMHYIWTRLCHGTANHEMLSLLKHRVSQSHQHPKENINYGETTNYGATQIGYMKYFYDFMCASSSVKSWHSMKKSNSLKSFIVELNGSVESYLLDNCIKIRKSVSPGLWLCFMLPLSIIIGSLNNTNCSTSYQTSTCLSVGLLLNSLTLIYQVNHSTTFRILCCVVNSVTTTFLLMYFTDNNTIFNILLGIMSSFGYNKLLLLTLQISPETFTFGEAAVIVQAIILFIASVFETTLTFIPITCIDVSTKILQIGVTGLCLLCLTVYMLPQFQKPLEFYSALGVIILLIVLTLHYLLGFSAILWLVNLLFEDMVSVKLVISWVVFSALAVCAAATQVKGGKKASTVVRKYFHLLALLVYLPGLVLKPCLLYVTSGIIFALFIGLEMIRVLKLPPFSSALASVFQVFADEKDSSLALTPIYLLVGCSGPLWLHPMPSTAPQSLLPLSAGLLSVAVGDTAASICGSLCGRHKWPDSEKTKEGTAACFISQLFFVIALIHFDFVPKHNLLQPIAAIFAVSLIEATTDQIDNLALPLVMYTMLL